MVEGRGRMERRAHLRQLEPVTRAYMERRLSENSKPLPQMSIVAARDYMQQSQNTPFANTSVHAEEREIAGVRSRVVRPANAVDALPVILYLHGGGWALGAPETHARLVCSLAERAAAAVVVPEYALAPEHRYPHALEQCVSIVRALKKGELRGLNPARIAVAGDSAGGNLAAALALRCAEQEIASFTLQALICPVLEATPSTASYREFASGFNLDADTMQWFWAQYVEESRRYEITASPLRASRELLARVAPAWIVTAGCDVLRDEGERYGEQLIEAGNAATVLRCAATVHNFPVIDDLQESGPAIAATAAMGEALRVALHSKTGARTVAQMERT
ncbi:MAG TPA: alpha/beta hydrolase [Acidobacteriaceae bacterium]|nr:alpha/beta hydrolase [Acidobacteriaceae bacterium]